MLVAAAEWHNGCPRFEGSCEGPTASPLKAPGLGVSGTGIFVGLGALTLFAHSGPSRVESRLRPPTCQGRAVLRCGSPCRPVESSARSERRAAPSGVHALED